MRVVHVTLYPSRGEKHGNNNTSGVASYSKNLVTHLARRRDNQTVICDVATDHDVYREEDVSVHRVFDRQPSFLLQIHRELKKVRPDVVHIQQELTLYGNVFTAYLLQWLVFVWRKKTVVTLHGVVNPHSVDRIFVRENNSRLPVWLVRFAFRVIYTPLMFWAQKIIVHEDYFKDIVVHGYRISPEKVTVIPHGVEPLRATRQSDARKKLHIAAKSKVVLFMGYATGYKGMDLLIEGFAGYANKHKDAFLVIGAGKHPKLLNDHNYLEEYARLQAKATNIIPASQYVWHGFIHESDITSYYSASDVSLYPYTTAMSSSGPMSFAIGYEKPFLVSAAFDRIFHDYPQLLFDHQQKSLTEKLEYFFTHQDEYESLSRNLKYQRSWRRVSEQTLRIYQDMADQKGAYETENSTAIG